jgi:hypothetical protein
MREATFYKPKHFIVQEFVPQETFEEHGDSSWQFLDPRLLQTMDLVREWFDRAVVVNNWASGGGYQYRGYRPPCVTVGAKESQHRFGRACDFDVDGLSAEAARKIILDHQNDSAFRFITRVELGVSWVHIDLANIDSVQIYPFNP